MINIVYTWTYILSLVSTIVVNMCHFCNLMNDYISQEGFLKNKTSE